ncbi:MAG: GMC oxidoreductase [Longimicrobiales bacterium]|nr:GMC oxidoreductase [Longimicrobiales bacterium]
MDRLTVSPQGEPPLSIVPPDIAVSFQPNVSRGGVRQRACTLCGDCVTGCNHVAKNTLPMNYLAAAKQLGAELFCGASVRRIERQKSGSWRLWVEPLQAGRELFGAPPLFVTADVVVLAAGSLGSTEILLRSSRSHGGTLDLSPQLGERFSGNADVIAFGYNTAERMDGVGTGARAPQVSRGAPGPTITGLVDLRAGDVERQLIIEEGAIPGALRLPSRILMPLFGLIDGSPTRSGWWSRLRAAFRAVTSLVLGAGRGALRNTQTYLVNGHDDGGPIGGLGRLVLHEGRLRVDWPWVATKTVFHRIDALLQRFTSALAGTHLPNPMWSVRGRRRLLTVHPLGGCGMGRDAEEGVVDHRGAVFDPASGDTAVHDGLYVSDGSVIPRSLGANPLLTISAIADRNAEKIAGDRGWEVRPLAEFDRPPSSRSARPGLTFSERMVGWVVPDEDAPLELPGGRIELVLTVEAGDVWRMCRDGSYKTSAFGTLSWPCLQEEPLTAVGTLRLFDPDPRRVETLKMRYELELRALDGSVYQLSGRKTIHDDRGLLDIWGDVSRVVFDLSEKRGEEWRHVARGRLRIPVRDLWRQLWSVRVTREPSLRKRMWGGLSFVHFFLKTLVRQYGWIFRPPDVADPYNPYDTFPSMAPAANIDVADVTSLKQLHYDGVRLLRSEGGTVWVQTADGAVVTLTRHRGRGLKGPVILAPGFGTSTIAFTISTNDRNGQRRSFADYLVSEGYDVWLFDYRASELSSASGTQFTLDDIAAYDWPAAVEAVLRIRQEEDRQDGRALTRSVQILGHCVGSLSLLMSLLAGHLHGGVRSVVCSQSLTHIDQPLVNRVKARLRLASLLHLIGGWPTYNPDFDVRSSWMSRMIDVPLRLMPWERCRNPVCRRIQFLYGSVNKHEQLNAATHDAMHEMFNEANKTTFEHLSDMILAGHLVSADGQEAYITPQGAARMRLPIGLLQGEANPIFRPRGLEWSYRWLTETPPPDALPHGLTWGTSAADADGGLVRKIVLRGRKVGEDRTSPDRYGHMDCFIGRDCWSETFPEILDELQRGDRVAAKLAGHGGPRTHQRQPEPWTLESSLQTSMEAP